MLFNRNKSYLPIKSDGELIRIPHNDILYIEKHKNDILAIKYYHIVLCLPKELYPLCYYNQKVMYDLLFKISSDVVLDCCYEHLGINVGITSILHTWSQKGKYYPHIHMLVTGGGGSYGGGVGGSGGSGIIVIRNKR